MQSRSGETNGGNCLLENCAVTAVCLLTEACVFWADAICAPAGPVREETKCPRLCQSRTRSKVFCPGWKTERLSWSRRDLRVISAWTHCLVLIRLLPVTRSCSGKSTGSIGSLIKWADTAFWLAPCHRPVDLNSKYRTRPCITNLYCFNFLIKFV